MADGIRLNVESLRTLAVDHAFLFVDAQQLVMKANDDLVALIKVRIAEHQKAEEAKAEAQREQIRKEELKRIEDESKAKQVVEPVAEPAPVVTSEPVKPAPVTQAAPKPVAATAQTPLSLQAEVFDLEALVHAVAVGQVPISVLSVNWEALDAMVAAKGQSFIAAGVRLVKVAA
jgi:hypothetical protein